MGEPQQLRALVFGATGAVGSELVRQLAASTRWKSVTTVGRRPLEDVPEQSPPGKLQQLTINMDAIENDPSVSKVLSSGVDTVFCALGTTRSVAGSADAFRKVDLEYVAAAARAAKAASVPHFSLVSAQGAAPNLWASDFKLFHGLLYAQTKGKAEEAVKSQAFSYATFMRPGMLDRGAMARPMEKLFSSMMPSVKASRVAEVMVTDAEKFHSGAAPGGVKEFSMKDIQQFEG